MTAAIENCEKIYPDAVKKYRENTGRYGKIETEKLNDIWFSLLQAVTTEGEQSACEKIEKGDLLT